MLLEGNAHHLAELIRVGALVVLYAQPLARISRLRLDATVDENDRLYLSFVDDRVLIPQPLAGLLRQLPWRRRRRPPPPGTTVAVMSPPPPPI